MLSLALQLGCVVLVPSDWADPEGQDPSRDSAPDEVLDVTIEALQTGAVAPDQRVRIEGFSAHPGFPGGVYLQDGSGGAWSGVWVAVEDHELVPMDEGDRLEVTGLYVERSDLTTVLPGQPGDITWLGADGNVSLATVLMPEELHDDGYMEAWEGTLVTVQDLFVTQISGDVTTFTVQVAGQDTLVVGDQLFQVPEVRLDDTLDSLTGLLTWVDGDWRLEPRTPEDVVGHEHAQLPADFDVYGLFTGDLVLTEFMLEAQDCDGLRCEWLELRVAVDGSVELQGLRLSDTHGNEATLSRSLVVPGQADVLLAMSTEEDWGLPGVVPAAYLGSDFVLTDIASTVTLSVLGSATDFDQVTWAAAEILPGASRQLDVTRTTATANDNTTNWCVSPDPLPGSSDRGSPGAANSPC